MASPPGHSRAPPGNFYSASTRQTARYAIAMVTLLAAAFVATLLPARRAASVDPTRALQQE